MRFMTGLKTTGIPETIAKKDLVVAGLPITIYSGSKRFWTEKSGSVAVMFFLHGRNGSAKSESIETIVRNTIEQVEQERERDKGALDFIIVTFDQRNHGERLVDRQANGAWKKDNNPRHAIDMYAIQTGTALDVSYLIDFLPSYLFPSGERQIEQWLVAGKSLGGHSTWIALAHESRISLAVPIIACPDYTKLITRRAKYSHVDLVPPTFPDSLRDYIMRNDPAQLPYTAPNESNPFFGKKVLVLSGGADPLVPFSCSEEFVTNLNVGPEGVKEVVVAPRVGHDCTSEMVKQMAGFIYEHALRTSC